MKKKKKKQKLIYKVTFGNNPFPRFTVFYFLFFFSKKKILKKKTKTKIYE